MINTVSSPHGAGNQSLLLFGLGSSRQFAGRVGQHLGLAPSPHEEREFEDGEHKARPLVSVRDRDVFVLHSLYGEPRQSGNDKLCRMLFFIGALKDAGAGRVTSPTRARTRRARRAILSPRGMSPHYSKPWAPTPSSPSMSITWPRSRTPFVAVPSISTPQPCSLPTLRRWSATARWSWSRRTPAA